MSDADVIYRDLYNRTPRTPAQFADLYESIMGRYDRYRDAVDSGNLRGVVCRNGHALTEENTFIYRDTFNCWTCRADRVLRHRAATRNRKLVTV